MSNEKLSPEIMEEIQERYKIPSSDNIYSILVANDPVRIDYGTLQNELQKAAIFGATIALTKQWVKVEDKEPEENKPYWIFGKVKRWIDENWSNEMVFTGPYYWNAGNKTWYNPAHKGFMLLDITHYAPYTLPSPPQD